MSVFSMDRVVEVLKTKSVNAYVEQTGGGTATIYAGSTWDEPDYGTRWSACAGPGVFGWGAKPSVGDTEEFCVGADDMGDTAESYRYFHEQADRPTATSEVEVYVAQMVYDRVVEWAAEKMVGLIKRDMEAGTVPTEWDGFESLHAHVDANMQYVHETLPLTEDGSDAYFDLCGAAIKAVEAAFDADRNPRAEALAAGTVLGQFEDHKDDCEFATGASATCTC